MKRWRKQLVVRGWAGARAPFFLGTCREVISLAQFTHSHQLKEILWTRVYLSTGWATQAFLIWCGPGCGGGLGPWASGWI